MRRIWTVGAAAAIALGGLLGGTGTAAAEPRLTYDWCGYFGGEIMLTEIPLTGEPTIACLLPLHTLWS